MELKELIELAKEASVHSYSPYSHYNLGAALLTKSGKVYKGTNVENASYPLTCCAERIAIFKAVSEGEREFDTIVIRSNDDSFPYPCGACRQVMAQFSKDLIVYVVNGKNEYERYTIKELLPHTFEF
ncbi:MAG: cytidine deaminase [Clostridia bacterium]|nr:cytidine deaminase [Clostridia bacterium]